MRLADKLDWVAKKKMLMEYMDSEGVEWGDDVLHSLDLEYHNINSATGLYYGLEELGEAHRMLTDDQIQSATKTPPQNYAGERPRRCHLATHRPQMVPLPH